MQELFQSCQELAQVFDTQPVAHQHSTWPSRPRQEAPIEAKRGVSVLLWSKTVEKRRLFACFLAFWAGFGGAQGAEAAGAGLVRICLGLEVKRRPAGHVQIFKASSSGPFSLAFRDFS